MLSRSFSILAGLLVCACGADVRRVDVCGRGDRPELAAALADGTLVITVVDGDGDALATGVVPVAGERIELDLDGGARIRVLGRDRNGAVVAEGDSPIADGEGACVCLALSGQTGACAGLACRASADEDGCAFFDAVTGDAAGSRELAFAAEATTLSAASPEQSFAGDDVIEVAVDARAALVRFDLTALPRTAVIEDAVLELAVLPPPAQTSGVPVALFPVLEPWLEDEATWSERATGEPWAAPGVAPPSRGETPWAAFDPDRAAETHRIPLGLEPAGWVADPASNHGLVLVAGGGPTELWSDEGSEPPRLTVRYHMADDDLPLPTPQPICGNGLVEDGEACDDGDTTDGDACTNACKVARCGDGIVRDGAEECDDGNDVNDDGCTVQCLVCDDPSAAAIHVGDDGRCYARYDTRRAFSVAENRCDGYGHGVLAAFETAAEQTEVLAAIGTDQPLMIGLTDRASEGTFLWSTGRALDYDAFADGEPVTPGGAIDCVVVVDGAWQTRSCGESNRYVCEKQGWSVDDAGRAYLAINGPALDWAGAQLECVALGAHLAVATSPEEHAFVAALTAFQAWIGLLEVGAGDEIGWVNGERFDYSGFPAPPDLAGDVYCGQLEGSGAWGVRPCAARRRFVCEQD